MTSWEESPEVEQLVWDEWNTEHIGKHGVSRNDVEGVIASEAVARATYKECFLVLGQTASGRVLAVVIGPVPDTPGAYYIFSARPASRQEWRYYHDAKGGEER